MQEMQEMQFQSLGQEDPLKKDMGNPLQYSCLENSIDRGSWWATVHGVTKCQIQLNTHKHSLTNSQGFLLKKVICLVALNIYVTRKSRFTMSQSYQVNTYDIGPRIRSSGF